MVRFYQITYNIVKKYILLFLLTFKSVFQVLRFKVNRQQHLIYMKFNIFAVVNLLYKQGNCTQRFANNNLIASL